MGWHINHVYEGSTFLNWILFPGARIGWAGVDLFFVLSGFLVGGLIFREVDRTGAFNLKRFFIRRMYRLWPVLYLFLFAMALSGIAPLKTFFWQIALHVQNYVPTQPAKHLWSLAVEEHFYILLSIGVCFLLRSKRGISYIPVITITIVIGSLIMRIVGWRLGATPLELQTMTHFRLDGLASGVFLAFLFYHKADTYEWLRRQKLIWAILLIACLCFLITVPKSTALGSTFGYTVSALASAFSLLLIHKCPFPKGSIAFFKPFAFLGIISYPLYLWHVPVVRVIERVDALTGVYSLFLSYAVSIAVAAAVTFFFERPIMRLRDRRTPSPMLIKTD